MTRTRQQLRPSELSEATFPRFREDLVAVEARGDTEHALRSYPGHRRIALVRPRARVLTRFDPIMESRRSARALADETLPRDALSRLLFLGHGVTGPDGRGPSPSAGNLQSVELYLVSRAPGWLSPGAYHYDRGAHALSDLAVRFEAGALLALVPSLTQVEGGSALIVLVGDTRRVAPKYGDRAPRFLLLEAGHVMQSIALAAHSVGASVVPIGGFFDEGLARRLRLPPYDAVLYCGVLGAPRDLA